jgi:hypothetical protein
MYLFTNVDDVESHIALNETSQYKYLTKFILRYDEKPLVMKELESMGINNYSLFGGADGLCRYLRESIFRKDQMGPSVSQRVTEFLKRFGQVPSTTHVPTSSD